VFAVALALPFDARADDEKRPWEMAVGFDQGYTDNVRWAQDGPDKDGAFFTTLKGELAWYNDENRYLPSEIRGGVRGRVFTKYSDRDFVEIFTRLAKEVGDNTLLLRYTYIPERLRLEDDPEEGAVFSSNHELTVGAERKLGPKKRFRVRLMFEGEWDNSTNGTADDRDSFLAAGVTDFRYRWHDAFVPRFGVRYGVRDAKSSNYDRDELDVEVGFDSNPRELLELSFRYAWLWRDYTVGSATGPDGSNSNYDREDNANQIEILVTIGIPGVDGLDVKLGYKLRDNDSTRDSREFDVNEGSAGLEYRFSLG
jgi:hypothetical protein